MQIKHTGQPYRSMYVSDSYQRVINNIDNFGDLTGIMTAYAQESFTDAITKASTFNTTVIVDKAVTISADLTIPANVHLVVKKGGSFSVDTGKTLTISGTVDVCGQEFSTIFTGSGTITYTTEQFHYGRTTFQHTIVDGNSKFISVEATPSNATQGARQAAMQISMTRYVAMTGTDGNSDIGFKCTVTNRAAGATFTRVRAAEFTGDMRDAGSSAQFVEGVQICAKTRSGTTVVDVTAARFLLDHGATGSGSIVGVQVQDVSQSATGTMYGILLNTSNYDITREFGIFIDSNAGSWTNAISFNGTITNVFDFENTDGTNGAGFNAGFANPAAYVVPDGYIKIDVGGNTLYLYAYPDVPT